MKILLKVITCLFLLSSCSTSENGEKLAEEMPEDFSFVLKYGFEARDIINTYENTYTKNMILDDDLTIEMIFSDEEMEVIYEEMKEADILYTAKKASENQCAEPHEQNELTLALDGKVYEREWITSYCAKTADRKLKDFINFIHHEMIVEKEGYDDLPEHSGGYD